MKAPNYYHMELYLRCGISPRFVNKNYYKMWQARGRSKAPGLSRMELLATIINHAKPLTVTKKRFCRVCRSGSVYVAKDRGKLEGALVFTSPCLEKWRLYRINYRICFEYGNTRSEYQWVFPHVSLSYHNNCSESA